MPQANDLSRSPVPGTKYTLIAVIELSQSSWLVAGIVPGIERQPVKKIEANEVALLRLLQRWGTRRPGLAVRSCASPLPSRPAAMVFGWRAGCGRVALRPM